MGKDQTEPQWPFEEFNRFLEECMEAAKIKHRGELSRLTGIRETQFSNWLYGTHRPSLKSLDTLGEVLGVPLEDLMFKAGHRVNRTAGDEVAAPPAKVAEFARLERVDKLLSPAERATLRSMIGAIVEGYEARVGSKRPGRT